LGRQPRAAGRRHRAAADRAADRHRLTPKIVVPRRRCGAIAIADQSVRKQNFRRWVIRKKCPPDTQPPHPLPPFYGQNAKTLKTRWSAKGTLPRRHQTGRSDAGRPKVLDGKL